MAALADDLVDTKQAFAKDILVTVERDGQAGDQHEVDHLRTGELREGGQEEVIVLVAFDPTTILAPVDEPALRHGAGADEHVRRCSQHGAFALRAEGKPAHLGCAHDRREGGTPLAGDGLDAAVAQVDTQIHPFSSSYLELV